jgi:riboflavin kinase/FMN adenylyltransferase
MRIFREIDQLPAFFNPVVSIGSFDGVHLGHQEILKFMTTRAGETDGETVLLTFWPHPRMILQPEDSSLKLLNTIDEKIELLEKSGLDNLIILPFTVEFSKMDYKDFITEILVNKLHVKSLVIGHDHHFGKNREGNFAQLQAFAPVYHFDLIQVDPIQIDGQALSSSLIRNTLETCDISYANQILGYEYSVTGTVVAGMKRGRELGYPTANISINEKFKLLPGDAIYAVEADYEGSALRGMASIGYNPTFNDTGKTLEVNIFDFDRQIYGEKITIKFLRFLRKEVKFATKEELVQQLGADKRDTLDFFSNR